MTHKDIIDVWVTFAEGNRLECEYTKGIDIITVGYNLDEYNDYREALADFILDEGLQSYSIKTHYLN